MVKDAPGAVRSMVTDEDEAAVAGPVLPAASDTLAVPRVRVRVPSEQPLTGMVIEVPEVAEGDPMTHPVAVPEVVKSEAERPLTVSEKVVVKVRLPAVWASLSCLKRAISTSNTRSRIVNPSVNTQPLAA